MALLLLVLGVAGLAGQEDAFPRLSLRPGDAYFSLGGRQLPIIGRNVTGNKLEQYEQVFDWMQAAGNRVARVHLGHSVGIGWDAQGRVDGYWAGFWDRVFTAAEQRGISLIPVFSVWADWRNDGALWENWANNPLNQAKGGPARRPAELLSNTPTRARWLAWLQVLVERWSARPNVAAWEIISEMNLISGGNEALCVDFFRAAQAVVRRADPQGRPIYASLAGMELWPAFFGLPEMDIVQVHPYGDTHDYNLDEKLAAVVGALRLQFRKPVLVGECDLDVGGEPGTHRLNESPRAAEGLRLALWANLFAGGMGTRFFWFNDSYAVWDQHFGLSYIEPKKDLEASLRRFAEGLDFAGLEPLPAQFGPELFGRVLGGSGLMIGWFKSSRVRADDWRPAPLRGASVQVAGAPSGTWRISYLSTADGASVLKTEERSTKDGVLTLGLPGFGSDLAFKAERLKGPEDHGRVLVRVAPAQQPGLLGLKTKSTNPALNGLALNDQGRNGDALARDGIWSGLVYFGSAEPQEFSVGAAAFRCVPVAGRLDIPPVRWEATGESGQRTLYFRGSSNDWGAELMTLGPGGLWSFELYLNRDETIQFKFCRAAASWDQGNWGDNEGDGKAESFGGNISFTAPAGARYRIEFREGDGSYVVKRR